MAHTRSFTINATMKRITTIRAITLLVSFLLPVLPLHATAGFAERINESTYFMTLAAPYFWSIWSVFALIMIFVAKRKSHYWWILLACSVVLATLCSNVYILMLLMMLAMYSMFFALLLAGIIWIFHLISRRPVSAHKDLLKGTLVLALCIAAIMLYALLCDFLRATFPIIDCTFHYTDPTLTT